MLPRVVIHNAVSADGRIDWFEADLGAFYDLAGRWHEDCALVGSGTILAAPESAKADPEPWEPHIVDASDTRPLLAIVDSRGRVRCWKTWLDMPYWRGGVALCSETTPDEYLQYLAKAGVDFIVAGSGKVDMRAALEELNARYGIETVRVDSGGILNGILLRAGLVDEVSILVHPTLVGGTTQRSMFRAPNLTSPAGVIALTFVSAQTVGEGLVWLRYKVAGRKRKAPRKTQDRPS
ncbi:MAG TPA: RibD family protein [Clostridia bacterium]|nr:RibD family protein [Clostridia bacterium]